MKLLDDISIRDNCLYIKGDRVLPFIRVEGGSMLIRDSIYERTINVRSFYISEIEVPNRLIAKILRNYDVPDNAAERAIDFPANNGTKENWLDFIERLNKKTGYKFRLPTNDEWDYAARGGQYSKGYKYAGGNNIDEVALYGMHTDSLGRVASRQKRPNELGLYDMSGSMWELTSTPMSESDPIIRRLMESYKKGMIEITEDLARMIENNISRGGAYDSPAEDCELKSSIKYVTKTGARLILEY